MDSSFCQVMCFDFTFCATIDKLMRNCIENCKTMLMTIFNDNVVSDGWFIVFHCFCFNFASIPNVKISALCPTSMQLDTSPKEPINEGEVSGAFLNPLPFLTQKLTRVSNSRGIIQHMYGKVHNSLNQLEETWLIRI